MSATAWTIWAPVAIAVAIAMEGWAALLHGRVWHGLLWRVHRSHHRARRGALEANDWLSALHAPIAIALILYGCRAAPGIAREAAFGVGVGMTIFGVAYLVCHDGMVHGRLPVGALLRLRYFARVRDAHVEHHRRGRAPYGFFAAPWTAAGRQAPRASSVARRTPQRATAGAPSAPSTSR